jgi:outer membrane protein assembly factor BamB
MSVQRFAPTVQERSWRAYLGGPTHAPPDGDSLADDPQPVWRVDVGRGIAGTPALTEELVIVAQVDRQVAVLERATGTVIWRRRLPTPPGTGPLVDGDRIFVATQEAAGRVHALRLRTGRGAWSAPIGDVVAPLLLDDSTVVAAATTGTVAAFGVGGTRLWRIRLPGAVRAAPVAVPAGIAVAATCDSLYLLDRRSGAVRRRLALRGSAVAAPALADSTLLVGTTGGDLLAVDAARLEVRWRHHLGGSAVGAVAAWRGAAWVLTDAGVLWRVPLGAPEAATHVATGVVARAGPLPSASGVLLAGVDGELLLVDPATGARRWSARLQAPLVQPPLLDGRFLIVAGLRGDLVAFR